VNLGCELLTAIGKGRALFTYGLANSLVVAGAIATGFHWGPMGVALAYGISGVVVRGPMLFWWTRKHAEIDLRSSMDEVLPSLGVSAAIAGMVILLRWAMAASSITQWWQEDRYEAIAGLAAAGIVAAITYGLVLLAWPKARGPLKQVLSLRRGRR
jgi:PST family polysaccharide transporter